MDVFMSQPWYAMVGEMVVMANMITMFVHKHWAKDNEFLSTIKKTSPEKFLNPIKTLVAARVFGRLQSKKKK